MIGERLARIAGVFVGVVLVAAGLSAIFGAHAGGFLLGDFDVRAGRVLGVIFLAFGVAFLVTAFWRQR